MGERNLYFDASREAEFNCIQVRQKIHLENVKIE